MKASAAFGVGTLRGHPGFGHPPKRQGAHAKRALHPTQIRKMSEHFGHPVFGRVPTQSGGCSTRMRQFIGVGTLRPVLILYKNTPPLSTSPQIFLSGTTFFPDLKKVLFRSNEAECLVGRHSHLGTLRKTGCPKIGLDPSKTGGCLQLSVGTLRGAGRVPKGAQGAHALDGSQQFDDIRARRAPSVIICDTAR